MVTRTGFEPKYNRKATLKRHYYYVIYDLEDNLKYYCDNSIELCNFTGIRHEDLNYFYNKRNLPFICTYINNKMYKVYRFYEEM